jgi:hypothetical protein
MPDDMNPTMRRDVDDTDAGAVPGYSGECAKARGQAEAWEAVVAALDLALGDEWIMRQGSGKDAAVAAIAEMASSLSSLRADADAVRAAAIYNHHPDTYTVPREAFDALMARKEGTDNG